MDIDLPLVGNRTLKLDPALALAGQGLRPTARPGRKVFEAAREAVRMAAAEGLVDARFLRRTVPVVERRDSDVVLRAGHLSGATIAGRLHGATRVSAVVCTIGGGLDDRVATLWHTDPLLALALEGLGTASCELLARLVWEEIEAQAGVEAMQTTGPLAPGMAGWPLLDAQRELFDLVDPAPLGVVLTSSGQMTPRKSLSFVIGLGVHVSRQNACYSCDSRNRCRFRPDHV